MYQNHPRKEIGTEHLYTFTVTILEMKHKVTDIFMVFVLSISNLEMIQSVGGNVQALFSITTLSNDLSACLSGSRGG